MESNKIIRSQTSSGEISDEEELEIQQKPKEIVSTKTIIQNAQFHGLELPRQQGVVTVSHLNILLQMVSKNMFIFLIIIKLAKICQMNLEI